MNKRSHIHKKADSSASNPVRSQFQSRPFIAQAKPQSSKPLTQTETENQEFQQQKFEATKLKLQAKYGTITPEGQEQLTVLQAKMSDLLQRRQEHASHLSRNFANIPISSPDAPSQLAVQTKLTIGEPGDKYEQEADRVAAQVVKQINAPVSQQVGQNLQREEMFVEEKDIQMKPMLQLRAAVGVKTATEDVETGIKQARGGGQPLAANIRQPMEQAFGADFSKVKVHTDTQADQLNQSIQAKAFTTGQDVFFRHGAYEPGSRGGQELIAHELTHVVQQGGGSVQRVVQRVPSPQQQKSLNASDIANHFIKSFKTVLVADINGHQLPKFYNETRTKEHAEDRLISWIYRNEAHLTQQGVLYNEEQRAAGKQNILNVIINNSPCQNCAEGLAELKATTVVDSIEIQTGSVSQAEGKEAIEYLAEFGIQVDWYDLEKELADRGVDLEEFCRENTTRDGRNLLDRLRARRNKTDKTKDQVG